MQNEISREGGGGGEGVEIRRGKGNFNEIIRKGLFVNKIQL